MLRHFDVIASQDSIIDQPATMLIGTRESGNFISQAFIGDSGETLLNSIQRVGEKL